MPKNRGGWEILLLKEGMVTCKGPTSGRGQNELGKKNRLRGAKKTKNKLMLSYKLHTSTSMASEER